MKQQEKNKKPSEAKEFNKFFRKNIAKKLGAAEALRQSVLKKIQITVVLAVVIVILVSGLFYYFSQTIDISLLLCLSGAVIAIPPIMAKIMYKSKVKKMVLENLLSFIGDFKIEETRNRDYVESLELFENFNRYSQDDRLKGKYGKLDVDISELRLTYESGSGKNHHSRTVFSGILVVVPSHKRFKGKTIVRKTGKGFFSKFKDVNLEDPVFMKLYKVFGSDQIEARYLLTTAFMNRMVKLDKKMSDKIVVSFENGNVNLALSSSKDWFEVPLMKPANDINNYKDIIMELKELLGIIDSLNLDSDIGL